MKWEPLIPYHNHDSLGQLASVYLDETKSYVKRTYDGTGVTVNGNATKHHPLKFDICWERESRWLEEFQNMPWTPELVEINHDKKYTIQKYYGPDLLEQGFNKVKDIEQQVLDIYSFFQKRNVYKFNGSLSNMTRNGPQLIIFDFKYMRIRSKPMKEYEEYSIETWLSKINPDLVPKLKALL